MGPLYCSCLACWRDWLGWQSVHSVVGWSQGLPDGLSVESMNRQTTSTITGNPATRQPATRFSLKRLLLAVAWFSLAAALPIWSVAVMRHFDPEAGTHACARRYGHPAAGVRSIR